MPGTLDFEEYGDAIGAAWTVLREHANRAGRDTPVPTCPGWTVADLVAHQGMVHRWVSATLRHEEIDTDAVEAEGRAASDLGAWLDDGAKDLLQALVDAPDEDGPFFLRDADRPKFAWARRQAHETSIHAVDAMAATLGRVPAAAETWLSPRVAADGVDELLTGFLPRSRHRLRTDEPTCVHVVATDTGHAWTLRLSDRPVVAVRGREGTPATVVSGTARGLYLWSWNRGSEVVEQGAPLEPAWADAIRVTWS